MSAANAAARISVNVPAKNGALEIALNENISVQFGGVVSNNAAEQIELVRSCIRSKVLKQFNIAEIAHTPVIGGGLHMNGNRTSMKLPKVKTDLNGKFAESLEQYYDRAKPDIRKWLVQSVQNAEISKESAAAIGL